MERMGMTRNTTTKKAASKPSKKVVHKGATRRKAAKKAAKKVAKKVVKKTTKKKVLKTAGKKTAKKSSNPRKKAPSKAAPRNKVPPNKATLPECPSQLVAATPAAEESGPPSSSVVKTHESPARPRPKSAVANLCLDEAALDQRPVDYREEQATVLEDMMAWGVPDPSGSHATDRDAPGVFPVAGETATDSQPGILRRTVSAALQFCRGLFRRT